MTAFTAPVVATAGSTDPAAPLVVLLHGRGSHEGEIIALADHLPDGPAYAAVRAPIGEGGGYAWFANRGIGRPVAESLRETLDWFRGWLDQIAPAGRPVVLIGFSGGAAFAGGLLFDDPRRYAGAAVARAGARPEVTSGIPQEQASDNAPRDLQERLFDLVAALPGITTRQSAIFVPGARGLMLDQQLRSTDGDAFLVPSAGEFAHVHPGHDGSMHLALPPALAADLLAKGWASPTRSPASG